MKRDIRFKTFLLLVLGILCFYLYSYIPNFCKFSIPVESENHLTFPTSLLTTTKAPKWSNIWPRVDLINCSHREYMNKGINSPKVIKNLRFLRTGLVSAPGSGNTWIRFLIEQATGLWTGSVFSDKSLHQGGLEGEIEQCHKNSTVIIKGQDERSNCTFERIVLVVRDLHRCLLAEFNRQFSKSHVGVVNETLLHSEAWTKFIQQNSYGSANINVNWISRFIEKTKKLKENDDPFTLPANYWKTLLLVSYERMKQDPMNELERILKFMGVPVFREYCLKKNPSGEFRRGKVKSAESIACLYDQPQLKSKMDLTIQYLIKSSKKLGAGNIIANFERIENIDTNEKCIPSER
ncbi:WSCD family member AAEL009094-like isoform X2 [Styela clava]